MARQIKTDIDKEVNKPEPISKRPQKLSEYAGQQNIKDNLNTFITAAKLKEKPLGHILFAGPPGLGKTTLAGIIANEMSTKIRSISAPAIEKTGDIASVLAAVEEGDVLFIDEIHRLPKNVEEVLYSAMEDFYIDILIGNGEQAKNVRMHLPHFTLIGATTREGMLSRPLHDRFEHCFKLDYYEDEELSIIAKKVAETENMSLSDKDYKLIASASRGTPRITVNLTKKITDYLLVHKNHTVKEALFALNIDENGLNDMDRKYITILEKFDERAVGVKTIASYLGEEPITIEEVIEPFLIRKGLILKTKAGRILSKNT